MYMHIHRAQQPRGADVRRLRSGLYAYFMQRSAMRKIRVARRTTCCCNCKLAVDSRAAARAQLQRGLISISDTRDTAHHGDAMPLKGWPSRVRIPKR